jgi:hypothetical protein
MRDDVGYAIMMGNCCACKRTIAFNPRAVPSLVVNGTREPLCRQCAERWNELHPENARPIRDDAYGPIDEREL